MTSARVIRAGSGLDVGLGRVLLDAAGSGEPPSITALH